MTQKHTKEELIYLSKLSEQAERYDEMVSYAKDFAKLRVLLAEALLPSDPVTARVHAVQAQAFLAEHTGFDALRRRTDALLRATSPDR